MIPTRIVDVDVASTDKMCKECECTVTICDGCGADLLQKEIVVYCDELYHYCEACKKLDDDENGANDPECDDLSDKE
jgi:hypothetical protein